VAELSDWTVGGAVIEGPECLLLVQNLRANGSLDWTPPGGVIEVRDGESLLDGLTREVVEETGLQVTAWHGPLYRVTTTAPAMGWRMLVEVYLAVSVEGEVRVGEDPDGIVVDAASDNFIGGAGADEPHKIVNSTGTASSSTRRRASSSMVRAASGPGA